VAACLVMNNTPEDLRLVMIDPKMVELVRFNGLPHLYGKVETDLERIVGVLRWCTAEMDRRYKLLEDRFAQSRPTTARCAAAEAPCANRRHDR
jgi:S-DNA-T family DNA segregation ATPase FtsK/SpoIIIE